MSPSSIPIIDSGSVFSLPLPQWWTKGMVKTGGAEVILVFSLQREKEIIRCVRNSVWPQDELINLRHFFFL